MKNRKSETAKMSRKILWNQRSYSAEEFDKLIAQAPADVAEKMKAAHAQWEKVAKTHDLDDAREWHKIMATIPLSTTFRDFLIRQR